MWYRGMPTFALMVLLMGLVPPVHACAVCGFGRDGTTSAYLLTAALMSLVPLLLAGGIAYLLCRYNRAPQRGT